MNNIQQCVINYYKELFEKYHISNIFNTCAEDIVNNPIFNKVTDDYIYTGWNFIQNEQTCIKYNNQNIHIPIKVKVKYDVNDVNHLSITDRKDSINSINITINLAQPIDNKYAGMQHEFMHALQMYICDYNAISNQQALIHDDDPDIIKIFGYGVLHKIDKLIYFALQSEQSAQINATIHYLKNIDIQTNDINVLIDKSNKYSQLNEYKNCLNTIQLWYNNRIFLNNMLVLAYYFQKYSGQISYTIINKADLLKYCEIPIQKKQEISERIYNLLSINYNKYRNKILDSIYLHILDKTK